MTARDQEHPSGALTPRWALGETAHRLYDRFFVAAAASFVGTRAYLALTGYPQIGGHGLHISHLLWGGLLMLVKQHAMELAPHAITVNGVAPTFIRSERIRSHLERDGFRDLILSRNPLGRIGDPAEVVGPVIALAAPAGSYVTGQVLYVDGGVTASQ